MNFQENLKKYREAAGYTQAKDFAKKLGIKYTTYVAYENQGREPKYEILCKIADKLGVSIDDLLGYKLDPAQRLINEINTALDKTRFAALYLKDDLIAFGEKEIEYIQDDKTYYKYDKFCEIPSNTIIAIYDSVYKDMTAQKNIKLENELAAILNREYTEYIKSLFDDSMINNSFDNDTYSSNKEKEKNKLTVKA